MSLSQEIEIPRQKKKRTWKDSFFWITMNGLYKLVRFGLKPDVKSLYQNVGADFIPSSQSHDYRDPTRPMWLNQGYWKNADNYFDACKDLARLLAKYAQLKAGDEVLDVGFGFGEQDLLFVREFNVDRVFGVNISPIQVKVGTDRVKASGLEGRITYDEGSATEIKYENDRFDKVVALECAVHFDTREDFLAEAYRVLKPNGLLALTDMLPRAGANFGGVYRNIQRRTQFIPNENMYAVEDLIKKLENIGFVDVQFESIAGYVFPGMAKYNNARVLNDQSSEEITVNLTEKDIRMCAGVELWEFPLGISDYVVLSAQKPK